jgi:hypothetical protein
MDWRIFSSRPGQLDVAGVPVDPQGDLTAGPAKVNCAARLHRRESRLAQLRRVASVRGGGPKLTDPSYKQPRKKEFSAS